MFINLQELEKHIVHFDVDIPAGEIDFDREIAQSTVLHAAGSAELLEHALGEIRLRGELRVTIDSACDRCLETVAFPIASSFDLVYMPASEAVEGGEDELDEDASEVGYYEGNGLQLNDALQEVVLLALPMQLVCSEDCKGICPVCGENRNKRECGCLERAADERWTKLKELRAEIGQRN